MSKPSRDLSKVRFTREELQEYYLDKHMSQRQIANHFHVDVRKVRYAMEQWGIVVRKGAENGDPFASRCPTPEETQKQFIDCYVNQLLSVPAISRRFNTSYAKVRGVLRKHLGSLRRQIHKPNPVSGLKDLYISYRRGANDRKHSFELTLEYFREITQRDCHYCGLPPSQYKSGYTYTGIDRIDNTKGYILGNVRPCCRTCNYAKRTMTEQEFYTWIQRLVAHYSK